MSNITKLPITRLLKRQPILWTKSLEPLDTQTLMNRVIELISAMLEQNINELPTESYKTHKNLLLGEKQSILDAVIALQAASLKNKELTYKYKTAEKNKPVEKSISSDDLAIIKNFVETLPDSDDK